MRESLKITDMKDTKLFKGIYTNNAQGANVMELASYMAKEPWSNQPQCVCRVLAVYAARLNDGFDDEARQKLKSLIPLLINTRADSKIESKRSRFIVHRTLTTILPIFVDALGLKEVSARLREIKNEPQSFKDASEFLRENKSIITLSAALAAEDAANANVYAFAVEDFTYATTYAIENVAYAATYANAYAAENVNARATIEAVENTAYATIYVATYANTCAADYAAKDILDKKEKWNKVCVKCNNSAIETLRLACEIK